MVRVVREWLGVDRITETAKDTTVYSAFTTAARTSMDTETKKFIDEVVQRSTGTVGELLSANWSIVDSTLAPIYGVTSAGATAHTSLPKRLGILNQAAFLSVFAHAQETAPVLRGVAIMRRVACMKLPDPQSLNIQVVPPAPDPAKSTRDRFDIHATDAVCTSCHNDHRPDRLRVRDVRRNGRSSARPERPAGTFNDAHLGANGALTSVNTTSNTTIATTLGLPQRLRGRLRRQQRAGDRAGAERAGARVPGSAIFPVVVGPERRLRRPTPSSRSSNMWKQMSSDQQGKFVEVLVAYVRSPLFDQRSAP